MCEPKAKYKVKSSIATVFHSIIHTGKDSAADNKLELVPSLETSDSDDGSNHLDLTTTTQNTDDRSIITPIQHHRPHANSGIYRLHQPATDNDDGGADPTTPSQDELYGPSEIGIDYSVDEEDQPYALLHPSLVGPAPSHDVLSDFDAYSLDGMSAVVDNNGNNDFNTSCDGGLNSNCSKRSPSPRDFDSVWGDEDDTTDGGDGNKSNDVGRKNNIEVMALVAMSSSPDTLSCKLDEIWAHKASVETLRQEILTAPLSYKDVTMNGCSCNRSAILSMLSDLDAKIEAAVEAIIDQKIDYSCINCDRVETKLSEVECALKNSERDRDAVVDTVNHLQGMRDQSDEKIRSLEKRIVELQCSFDASLKQGEVYASEMLRLDTALREATNDSKVISQESDLVAGQMRALKEKQIRLEHTIDLLVEDYRVATEKLVDAEDAIVQQSLCDSDEAVNQRVSELVEEKDRLENEVKKVSKERLHAWDKLNLQNQEHKGVIEKLNEQLTDTSQQVVMLEKTLEETKACNVSTINELEAKVAGLSEENDAATLTMAELTARCDKLSEDLEVSLAKIFELESEKHQSELSAQKLACDVEALNAEKADLEERATKLAESEKKLAELHNNAEENVQRLSNEVIFTHEEISRLSTEKEAIMEEYESQLQKASIRLNELEAEKKCKSEEYNELWTRYNSLLLEKESAISTVKSLQHEKEAIASEGLSKEQEELKAKVEELQSENKQQKQQIEAMRQAEEILREMNKLLQSEKELEVEQTKQELQAELNQLRHANVSLSDETSTMKKEYIAENNRMQRELAHRLSEEEDLTWKINALTQNMSLRLNEKDLIISQLGNQIKGQINEAAILKSELRKRDAEKSSVESKLNALQKFDAIIAKQQLELKKKDGMILKLRGGETHYQAEILRMQSKVDRMEEWLHE